MERVDIKESFGNEVSFTKYISEDFDTKIRLLESLGYSIDGECEYDVEIESKTKDSKRVDIVIKDKDKSVINIIESQDSTGWLDTIHSSKISYYCWEKECYFGTLITEDASEHIKGYVKWLNENTPLNITILKTLIYELNDGSYYVDFFPIMRWIDGKEKKIESRKPIIKNIISDDVHYSKTNEKLVLKFLALKNKCESMFKMEFISKNQYISSNISDSNVNIMYCKFRNSKIIIDLHRGNSHQNGETSKNFFTIDKEYPFIDEITWTWKSGVMGNKYSMTFNEDSDIETITNIIGQKVNNVKI